VIQSFTLPNAKYGGFTLFALLFQASYASVQALELNLELTTLRTKHEDLQLGLFHVRSPLLMESQLISFPPLINMLKFSG
jgi:hypothetical protein